MFLRQLFDRESSTYTYLLADERHLKPRLLILLKNSLNVM
jgi:hypothetical protein